MHESLFLCDRPCRYIASQRVLLVVECQAAGNVVPIGETYTIHVTLRPLAIIMFDQERGRVALAAGTSMERVEQLLLEETRWA